MTFSALTLDVVGQQENMTASSSRGADGWPTKGRCPLAEIFGALVALKKAVEEFLDSGIQSGAGENDDPPCRKNVARGGDLHSAVVVVEGLLGGKLPSPVPRDAWLTLTRARDVETNDVEWQRVSHESAGVLLDWVQQELRIVVGSIPAERLSILKDSRLSELAYELEYRKLARQIVPEFETTSADNHKLAPIVCQKTGVQPREFAAMDAKERIPFLKMTLAKGAFVQWTLYPFKNYSSSIGSFSAHALQHLASPLPIPSREPTTDEISLIHRNVLGFDHQRPNWDSVKGVLLAHGVAGIDESTSLDTVIGILRTIDKRNDGGSAMKRGSSLIAPFGPSAEPALLDSAYDEILGAIESMVHVFERNPAAFKMMGEEDLRTQLLVGLNGIYKGGATGETFNGQGKTDILIRHDDRNVFIAECLVWKGQEYLRGKMDDQLFKYATWRDSKLAILVFNRNKGFSEVIAKMKETVLGHSQCVRELSYDHQSGARYQFRRSDDTSREFTLTCLAFDVPT